MLPMESPISLLNSLCGIKEVPCQYTMVSREGQVHSPTFTYRCEVGDFVEEASGQSKKKAKHEVAKKMLIKLLTEGQWQIDGRQEILKKLQEESKRTETGGDIKNQTNSEGNVDGELKGDAADFDPDNPVGKLQEICMRKHWNPPVYNFEQEVGPPHDREFKYSCTIENMNIVEHGQGKSKKTAKRESAVVMLNRLRAENLHRVDEILDRMPKKPGQLAQQEGSFDIVAELITVRNNLNEEWRKKRNYFENITSNTEKMTKLVALFAKPIVEIYQESFNEESLLKLYSLAQKIVTIIDCKLETAVMPAKNEREFFDCYTDIVSVDPKFSDVVVVTGWGSDPEFEMAKIRSVCKAIVMFLSLFSQPLSKIEPPKAEQPQDEPKPLIVQVENKDTKHVERPTDVKKKFPQLNFDDED